MSGIIGMSIAEGIRIEMPTSLPDRDTNIKDRPCPPSKSIKKDHWKPKWMTRPDGDRLKVRAAMRRPGGSWF
jgi:hypothetical protein